MPSSPLVDDPLVKRALEVARSAAREAGKLQREGLARQLRITHKGRYDLVTDVDQRSEEVIGRMLRQAFPQAGLLAEEGSPDFACTDSDQLWIVDPLDGTTNYARGYPVFCSSLALKLDNEIVLGVVYDPLRDELFESVRGQGARLNGQAIQVSDTSGLSDSLLATGFPYDRLDHPETNLDRFCAMTMRTRGVRRSGSAALDLCHTACGRLDGYWEIRLKPWDISAGVLMVQEAGGRVTSLNGQPQDWTGAEILASNGTMHDALVQSLAQAWPNTPCFG